ncbi:MAG: capsular polysaccharide biosynthesis protein, partial [Myxococcota bacterium]
LAYVALEDGFVRSVGLGADAPPLSLVIDDRGIYYDARGPSRLEAMLAGSGPNDPLDGDRLLERARRLRERIVEARVSKYNDSPVRLPEWCLARDRELVLVVDQTWGDASVTGGLADPGTFVRMLDAARRENPGARLLVKVHPATVAGTKQGYLDRVRADGVEVLAESVNPIALLEQVSRVYVCSSQLGFEALLVGKPVACFGAPFYAGWGLTDDRVALPRRGRSRTVDQLVAAALLLYPRYVDPMTRRRCEAERVVEHLALQRRVFEENARDHYCLGFTAWKRPYVRRYLHSPGHEVHFADTWAELLCMDKPSGSAVVIWGKRQPRRALRGELPVYCMEDGFLRSVRLGSELTAPGSLVLDEEGIYYDPQRVSDLEQILARSVFTADELGRARRLRQRITALGVSKYNLPSRAVRLGARAGQRVVFVPGQVADDASVRLGSPEVRSDRELLSAVRRIRPDAYVAYKPHPDVLSGNRRGEIVGASSGLWDERVEGGSVADCLRQAHEVHTMTSLVGFEALLRKLPVVVHGQPFYAGWGLTEDRCPVQRRGRVLELDELVAAVLLRYLRGGGHGGGARARAGRADVVVPAALGGAQGSGRVGLGEGLGPCLRRLRIAGC